MPENLRKAVEERGRNIQISLCTFIPEPKYPEPVDMEELRRYYEELARTGDLEDLPSEDGDDL